MSEIELPSDLPTLRILLNQLKDKEARLEADLAIREFPELEAGIAKVVMALATVRRLDKSVSVPKLADMAAKREREAAPRQLDIYQKKIAELEECLKARESAPLRTQLQFWRSRLAGVTKLMSMAESKGGGEDGRFAGMKAAKDVALANFVLIYREWEAQFEKHSVKMADLLPSVSYYLNTYESAKT